MIDLIPDTATRIVLSPWYLPSGQLAGGRQFTWASSAREVLASLDLSQSAPPVVEIGPRLLHVTPAWWLWDDGMILRQGVGGETRSVPTVLSPAGEDVIEMVLFDPTLRATYRETWWPLLAANNHAVEHVGHHRVPVPGIDGSWALIRHHFTAGPFPVGDLWQVRLTWKWDPKDDPYYDAYNYVGGGYDRFFLTRADADADITRDKWPPQSAPLYRPTRRPSQ
ncbi:hypothetical protein Lfu02_01590 [Longispora fulva]|uniref:Uncharacterized protein n=1 Tax=Longispora fulva TaxID=619741 RepID=A0A8J7GDA3_9ACTN|nr:hypothetical protein [Longispora fulva]MBG6135970.1 hypothetical protein [Longispora fulva]GIG55787.1 hypothetical protein Lfu02_01590 [Longispora fulva]